MAVVPGRAEIALIAEKAPVRSSSKLGSGTPGGKLSAASATASRTSDQVCSISASERLQASSTRTKESPVREVDSISLI